MAANLIFSQSNYPIQKVIDGDTFVILRKSQADTINAIFESQKAKIARFKAETKIKDSIIAIRDTLLVYYSSKIVEYNTIINKEVVEVNKIDTISDWLYQRAIEGSWVYYSYRNGEVVAVDLSEYVIRKNDFTGDIMFYRRTEDCPIDNRDENEPPKEWQMDIAKPYRPKLNKLKLKL